MKILVLWSLTSVLCFGHLPTQAVEIIAHRGASHDAPENTLAAVSLGWQQAKDGVEIDIHLSRDGRIVVIHDYDTKRIAGVDRRIADQTLSELRALDAGKWKGKRWTGEKIPTLEEVLSTVPDGKRLFIEIKCGPEVLPELKRLIEASRKKPEQLVLIAFSYEVVKRAKAGLPAIQTYWLYDWKKDKDTGAEFAPDEVTAKATAAGVDGIDVSFKGPVDAAFVRKAKSAGLKVYVWTVDDPEAARELVAAGVDGITTNRPGWLREKLDTAR
jgi:glycerophosphoryl diester phosphodiesterase